MTETLQFVKMEGLGNDFIVLDGESDVRTGKIKEHAVELCDRRKGIGADGVICVLPSQIADYRMRIFNSDGSEPEMCGNGVRCFTRYLQEKKLTTKQSVSIDTLAGLIQVQTQGDLYKVNMGIPRFSPAQIPVESGDSEFFMKDITAKDTTFKVTAVSMGNPHAVIYSDDLSDELVLGYGPILENHPLFPKRTNVEFIKILSPKEISMRVWERGCGETQACGTGACAAAVSGIVNKLHDNQVTVHLPGGDLFISWDGDRESPVFMTGPARTVFNGTVEVDL